MQAIPAFQVGIQGNVPVLPTFESQNDTRITNPLVSCYECDTIWRSHMITLCPNCARMTGQRFFLDVEQMWDLMEAVSHLDEPLTFDSETESETGEFRKLLFEHTLWYSPSCRMTIQACYEALRFRPAHPKIAYAMAFFEREYVEAPEDEMMYNPDEEEEVPNYSYDPMYDLQTPCW